jgi:polyphosphate kinase
VRVAGLIGQERAGFTSPSPDGRTPAQQLAAIHERARALLAAQREEWQRVRGLLAAEGISVCDPADLSDRTALGCKTCSWSGSSRC